jgi:hypothetical protein
LGPAWGNFFSRWHDRLRLLDAFARILEAMQDSGRHVNGCASLDIPALVADDSDALTFMNEHDFISFSCV